MKFSKTKTSSKHKTTFSAATTTKVFFLTFFQTFLIPRRYRFFNTVKVQLTKIAEKYFVLKLDAIRRNFLFFFQKSRLNYF